MAPERIYTDHGLTGRTRERPGLAQALAAVRAGDTFVVTRLDRLARSVPDARMIADQLVGRRVKLALGSTTYDPNDPMGKMFFNILATFAEFESDLIRMRTREGMAIARAKGKLRGKRPKLSDRQARELRRMHDTGDYSVSDLAELFLGVPSNRVPNPSAATCSLTPPWGAGVLAQGAGVFPARGGPRLSGGRTGKRQERRHAGVLPRAARAGAPARRGTVEAHGHPGVGPRDERRRRHAER